MKNICDRRKRPLRTYDRNSWWCLKLWKQAREWRRYAGADFPGKRRYWRRRMSDLARTLKQKYGIGAEGLA